jgi:glucosamine--fructose-6-phosphate aminotransferase (isomerizing)
MTSPLQEEILEQPAALQRLLNSQSEVIQRIADAIRERRPRFVLIAARGSSDNAARYAQYLFGVHHQLPVALAAPSLFTLYNSPPRLADALVIAISQSGQSPDILAVIEEGKKQKAFTLAVTNDTASPLANLAEHVIDLCAGPEKSIAATKTYTTSLLALAMLSTYLSEDKAQRLLLDDVPALVSRSLAPLELMDAIARKYASADACVVLGRGYNYSTAFEIALKIKELAYVLAEPYSSADFQHGPVALVEDGFPVVAVIPEGKTQPELITLLRTLKPRKPELVVISSSKEALELATSPITIPANIPEWISPMIAIVPAQQLALNLALARGFNPENPRGLNKVTKTR